ncbi:MlaA family lipoprotein [Massilia endophytica]|uniref:MlaA family lipoprotein n=1 Tax=Massilia endophytica TaxID=2899220 RepID=UPI001E520F11|nr:VacJ family lipoprotein [Massilia endophytica]UGQ46524.1 VacJ family lipoprotein [Massilia endophytica]
MSQSTLRHSLLALAAAAALSGCATSSNPADPLEGYNRAMFKFNDAVDRAVLKPVATGYKNVTPDFVQTGVANFFGNLSDVWTAANNLMQGKGKEGMSDVMRVALNSTFGLLGVLDIASEAGLQKHNEDLGQTMGYYGVTPGPYIVLPLFGPSTLRDTVGLPADLAADPWAYKDPVNVRNIGSGVRLIDKRAQLLDASSLLEDAALDRYEFVRDGWLQRRRSQVYDGDPPPEPQKKESD